MAKKLTKEQEQKYAVEGIDILKKTATKDVTFQHEGKEYTVTGAKLKRGIVKDLNLTNEGEVASMFQKLWDRQVALVEGLEAVLDELDWDEFDELFNEWFSPISDGFDELEKKFS